MAISVGNAANSGVLVGANNTTFALNNNKEDVIVLVALRDTETAANVTATYGAEAMTQDASVLMEDSDSTADHRCLIFRKQGALTGANNVVVTFSNPIDHGAVFAIAVADLNDTGQPDSTATGSNPLGGGGSADPSVQITTVANDCIILDVVYNKTGNTLTPNGSQTSIGNLSPNGGGDRAAASYKIVSSAGLQTMSWATASGGDQDDWSQAVVAYKQTVVAGAQPKPFALMGVG